MYNAGNFEGLKVKYRSAIDTGDFQKIVANRFALLGYSYSDSYGGADLSTMDPNPSVPNLTDSGGGTDWSAIFNTAGQWGATIASIATQPQQQTVIRQPSGFGQYSTRPGPAMGNLILLLIAGVVIYLLIER